MTFTNCDETGSNTFTTFGCQAGGHSTVDGKLCFLVDKDGMLCKLVVKTLGEETFYKQVYESGDSSLVELRKFIPHYYGPLEVTSGSHQSMDSSRYIKLENLIKNYKHPSVLDIKLGIVSSDPYATKEKVAYEKGKYAYQEQLGFRIGGSKIFDASSQTYSKHNRKFYSEMTPNNISGVFSSFLDLKNHPQRRVFVQTFVDKLTAMRNWFLTQTKIDFYSTSLLFCFDADDNVKHTADRCDVKMIDFCHCYFDLSDELDSNNLHGLNTLLTMWKQLLL